MGRATAVTDRAQRSTSGATRKAIANAGDLLAVQDEALASMTPREQAEAAWTPTSRFSVDELEDRIRARRGLPPKSVDPTGPSSKSAPAGALTPARALIRHLPTKGIEPMSNATQEPGHGSTDTSHQCPIFTWCDEPADHHPEDHRGTPDMSPITATGRRSDCIATGAGVVMAPGVVVAVTADTRFEPHPAAQVELMIQLPDGRWLDAEMTVDEADFLRRHLVQALRMLGREVAS